MKPVLLTVSTRGEPMNLKNSAIKFGYDFNCLGIGQKWTGFHLKHKLFLEALSQTKYDDKQLFVIVDAYDLIVSANATHLINIFKEVERDGYQIIVGAENTCIGYTCAGKQKIPIDTNLKYVNAGCVVGRKKALYYYYKQAYPQLTLKYEDKTDIDDQFILGEYVQKQPNAYMDSEARVVWNVSITTMSTFLKNIKKDGIPRSLHHDKYPTCFLHFPALDIQDILVRLYNHFSYQINDILHEPTQLNVFYRLKRFILTDFPYGYRILLLLLLIFYIIILMGLIIWIIGGCGNWSVVIKYIGYTLILLFFIYLCMLMIVYFPTVWFYSDLKQINVV